MAEKCHDDLHSELKSDSRRDLSWQKVCYLWQWAYHLSFQIEIKFYIYNSNNCSMFVWKGKSSWNIFLFVINNFQIIFHWLSIISTIYILFIYCRHCFRLYNRFSVSYFSQRKKESSEDEIHSNEKFHYPNFERGSLKRATFPITKWLPIIRLLALLYLDSIANFFFFFFS